MRYFIHFIIHVGRLLPALLALLFASGCASVGKDFPHDRVASLQPGHSTQAEVRALFGEPWRTGLENGQTTWTYGLYRYRLFGDTETSDLLIRFDQQGRVSTYSFSTTRRALPSASR